MLATLKLANVIGEVRKSDGVVNDYATACDRMPFMPTERTEDNIVDSNEKNQNRTSITSKKCTMKDLGLGGFDIGFFEKQFNEAFDEVYTSADKCIALNVFKYFIEKYKEVFGADHPRISTGSLKTILANWDNFENSSFADGLDEGCYQEMIDFYFAQKFKRPCDYAITHFFSGKIRENCFYKTLYYL